METGRLLDGRLKIRHLLLVTSIADAGSVVRAAEAMHITQPVVTRGLRDVEEILGVNLFDRLPRGVRPTVYGELFIDHARVILAQLRSADEQVFLMRTGGLGTVTVGSHLAGSNLRLPRASAALKAEHPRLVVSVREATPDTLQQSLLAGELDLIVGRLTPGTSDRLRRHKLYDEPIRLVARHGHPAHDITDPTLADLVDYPWVVPVAQTALRAELERAFTEQGLAIPDNRVECTSMLTMHQLLVSTDVIAALPILIATQDDELKLLSTGLGSIRRSVGVTVPTDRLPSPGTRLLLHHLGEEGKVLASELEE